MKKNKYWNRIKTLYWFWRMTRHWVDERWVLERGEYPEGYPRGKKWMELYTPNEYLTANRDK